MLSSTLFGMRHMPRRLPHGALAAGAGALSFAGGIGQCQAASTFAEAAPPKCAIIAGIRERFMRCRASKIDKKLVAVAEAEDRLLEMMGPGTAYEVFDVPVKISGFGSRCVLTGPETDFTIHTVVVGAEHVDKTPIVLVHGFMMGAASFWKLLPLLARHRTVYAIDIIGMAGSSRPAFDPKVVTPEDTEVLLTEPFERWAEAMQLKRFALFGHSFGGLVSAYWATRQPDAVVCLGLLSPCLGFSNERIDKFTAASRGEDATWQRRALLSIVECVWSNHITPQSFVRWIPGFKGLLERSTERRYQSMASGISEAEGKVLAEYVVATMDTPASTEQAGAVLFEPFLRPVEVEGGSIKNRLAALQGVPLFAVYGDKDWMESPPQSELPNGEFFTLADSGHHLALDAPAALASLLLEQMRRFA